MGAGLVSFSGVEPQPYKYLWFPYLIEDNLNLLFGDGGGGKSFLSIAIVAAVTGGQPDGMPGLITQRGNVLLFAGEDDAPQIKHRLLQTCADPARVFFLDGGRICLDQTALLRTYVRQVSARLVVFDPIQAFIPGVDMNKASEVRPLMEGLRAICREEHCTALLIGHSNKMEKAGIAQHRASGSSDFVNAARSALLVGYHPTQDGLRCMAQVKTNGERGDTVLFSIGCDGLTWAGRSDITGEEVMNNPRRKQALAPAINPVVTLIEREVLRHGGGWEAWPADLPEAARRYPDLSPLHALPEIRIGSTIKTQLQARGIHGVRARNKPWFFSKEA